MHLWGCVIGKTGQPEKDDDAAIQEYVDLRAADASLGFCQAIEVVSVVSMGGNRQRNYWRLKKKIPRKEERGQLPKAKPRADRMMLYTAAVLDLYRQRDAKTASVEDEHARTEEEAVACGMDINGQRKLFDLLQELDRSKSTLQILLSSPEIAFEHLLRHGVTDPVEVAAQIAGAVQALEDVKKKIEVGERLLRLRRFLGMEV